jgi:F0F1-type ATP synthase membrane subunit b/b'
VLLWALVAVGIVVGLVLYFIYERQITPLVG